MLIEFRVSNHRSIKDEQVLSLEAANLGNGNDVRPRLVEGHKKPLLPVAAIYGANASGKSNLLSAFSWFLGTVDSFSDWKRARIPAQPFAFGNTNDLPSVYEATFLVDGIRLLYGLAVNREEVKEEWLHAWPKGRRQIWFQRNEGEFEFGPKFSGENTSIAKVTRPTATFLSTAILMDHPHITRISEWMRHWGFIHVNSRRFVDALNNSSSRLMFEGERWDEWRSKMREFLKVADLGVTDVQMVEQLEYDEESPWEEPQEVRRFEFFHYGDDDGGWLDLYEESKGTREYFERAIPVMDSLANGTGLVIDELESSLHPLLALKIVDLFNNPKTNPKNAQLIFATHDSNLLGTTLGEPALRRDQVWFTEKKPDGSTELYPLTDYKPRNVENIERGYLQGRYGAIPFLGDFSVLNGEG